MSGSARRHQVGHTVGHRISIFLAALMVAIIVAAPAAAVVTTTVVVGGSADVSLTVNSGFEPTFSAQPTGGLIVTFSEVIPVSGTENFWASTMTVNAGSAGPGQYQFPLDVRDSGGAVLSETVVVTVEEIAPPPTSGTTTTSPSPTTTSAPSATSTISTTSTTTTTITVAETTLPPTSVTTTTSSTSTTTTILPTSEATPATTAVAIGAPIEPDDGFPTGSALVFGATTLIVVGAVLALYAYRQRARQRPLRLPTYLLEEEDGS